MPALRTFVLDEQVAIWAWSTCDVSLQGDRYVVAQPRRGELRAAKLLIAVQEKGLTYGLSSQLLRKYEAHLGMLQAGNVPMLGVDLRTHLNWARTSERLVVRRRIPSRSLPPRVKEDDQYLVELCAALQCNLVTEDGPLRKALSSGNLAGKLGITVRTLDQALAFVESL